jgi:curved DNA-binding protein CbpA
MLEARRRQVEVPMPPRPRHDRDYYALLGVSPEATADEIRRAYRRLALEWHPDRNPGNPAAGERFKEISEAYAVLVDAVRRREYDGARRAGVPYAARSSREDLFRDLFADPFASGVFEELAREFERRGLRVDRHYFRRTLFGGRAVVTGGIFVITPLTPVLALLRAAQRGLRRAPAAAGSRGPLPPGPMAALGGLARWLVGAPVRSGAETRLASPAGGLRGDLMRLVGWALGKGDRGPAGPGPDDIVLPIRLTSAEARQGVRRPITLERGGPREEIAVRIPAGVRPGTWLRLRGKGRVRAGGGPPGDAYLVVEIGEP